MNVDSLNMEVRPYYGIDWTRSCVQLQTTAGQLGLTSYMLLTIDGS